MVEVSFEEVDSPVVEVSFEEVDAFVEELVFEDASFVDWELSSVEEEASFEEEDLPIDEEFKTVLWYDFGASPIYAVEFT